MAAKQSDKQLETTLGAGPHLCSAARDPRQNASTAAHVDNDDARGVQLPKPVPILEARW